MSKFKTSIQCPKSWKLAGQARTFNNYFQYLYKCFNLKYIYIMVYIG